MGRIFRLLPFIVVLTTAAAGTNAPPSASQPPAPEIAWQPWSDTLFEQARREHKYVLLDLQAVWCHWCHVMDVQTYADPRVRALIAARYIAVRVDQDARPDLASRYQDYGWPATVVFNEDAGEIVKRQGFLPPEQMASMLQAILDDPSPGPSVTGSRSASPDSAEGALDSTALEKQLWAGYDDKLGSWGTDQKFLNWDNVEYATARAQAGDARAEKAARQTLEAQRKLIDPVWGGVDQYSAEGDWDHPHFEKIMQMQAENIRSYARAYALWHEPVYCQTAEGIYHYVRRFLTSPDGVVYTSQDADLVAGVHAAAYFALDDAARQKLGVPRVDTHIYARENGWFITALASLAAVTGDPKYAQEGERAATWIVAHRSRPGGGFRHGAEPSGPAALGDTLAMGRAFLSLYEVTADRRWLECASTAARFIDAAFPYRTNGSVVGYATAAGPSAPGLPAPGPDFDENVALARFANLLGHYSGDPQGRTMAQNALRFLALPDVVRDRLSSVGGLLLAEKESGSDPLHVAVVGGKHDAAAAQLFRAALAFPGDYKQVEWVDRAEKEQPPDSDLYPVTARSAAYICTHRACSAPVWDEARLTAQLAKRSAL